MNLRHVAGRIFAFWAMCIAGFTSSMQLAVAENRDVTVAISEYSPSGGSHDGMRIYLLPWETTTANPPDIAICVVDLVGQNDCYHKTLDDGVLAALCPDSPRCTFRVKWPSNQIAGIAIFDIDNFGQATVDSATNTLRRWLGGKADVVDDAIKTVDETNDRRFSWIENLMVYPFEAGISEVEKEILAGHLRELVASKVPPQFSDIRRGRLSAPIDAIPYENCEDPAPACQLNYASVRFGFMEM